MGTWIAKHVTLIADDLESTVTAFSVSVVHSAAKTYTEQHERLFGAMTVPEDKALLAIQLLLEGTSIRSTERVTEIHRDTIIKLLVLANSGNDNQDSRRKT